MVLVVPLALVVGCGSSAKTATAPAPAPTSVRTVTVTPSPSPTLDANAKLACSRIDDSLNAFKAYGEDVGHTLDETNPLFQALTFALKSKSPGLSDLAYQVSGGSSVPASASPQHLISGFPADASQLRDWCVTHGWSSTSSSETSTFGS